MNGSTSRSTSTPGIVPGMMDVYNQLVGINQQRYQNVLSAYQQGLGQLNTQLGGIYGGYNQLTNRVLGQLGLAGGGWGIAAPAATAIRQQQAQTGGQVQQRMIDAGLGNTTVQANLAQQNALYAQQAYGSLGSQLAQTAAGYTSQIGLAGLSARMQGAGLAANYYQGGLGHLGQQLHNPAGNMIGNFGQSVSTSYGYGGGGGGGGLAPSGNQMFKPYDSGGGGGRGGYYDPYTQPGIMGTYGFSSGGGGGYSGPVGDYDYGSGYSGGSVDLSGYGGGDWGYADGGGDWGY